MGEGGDGISLADRGDVVGGPLGDQKGGGSSSPRSDFLLGENVKECTAQSAEKKSLSMNLYYILKKRLCSFCK